MAKHFTKPPLGTPLNPAHPLNRGLMCYLPFNEGAGGKTHDLSGKGNHGTLTNMVQGATSGWAGGKFGGAIAFDGSNDFVAVSNYVGQPTIFTVAHWIKLSASQTSKTFFSNYNGTGNGWVTGIHDSVANVLKFYLGAGINLFSIKVLGNNIWYHVVVTYNNGSPKIYIDGVLDNSSSATITYSGTSGANDIGQLAPDNSQRFNGQISEVRYYNRALSETEVRQLYTDPFCMYEQKSFFKYFFGTIKKGSFFFR